MLYIGVDGGGTRTTAVAADENGNILFRETGETINFYSVGMSRAKENFAAIIEKIKEKTGCNSFKSVFIGSSALSGEADEKLLNEFTDGVINAEYIGMNSDLYAALCACDTDLPRIAVISGTGSMCAGLCADGEIHTRGGWGHILGDEGSAYAIALSAVKSVMLSYDNKTENPLTRLCENFFKISGADELIDKIYSPDMTKDKLALFASRVCAEAENGNEFARKILCDECEKLFITFTGLADEIKCEDIFLYGGVFQHCKIFAEYFKETALKKYPGLKIKLLPLTPEEGALRAAYKIEKQ